MYQGFWQNLPRPIIGLSPMDGVTDQPFRYITKKYGRPDVVFTEFTSAEGVSHNATRLFRDFLYDETQRPIVAQIFGKDPAAFRTTALILCYLGFDGIDINMGCPAKNVSHSGSGAALIKTPQLAQEIIRQTQAGVQDFVNGKTLNECKELKKKTRDLVMARHKLLPADYQQRRLIPVSVKTRIGYDQPSVGDWLPYLLEMEPAVITVHGRTLKQLYSGQADWEAIAQAVELAKSTDTLILGNGDLQTPDDVFTRIKQTGVDGVLIGRATFGNPWVIDAVVCQRDNQQSSDSPDKFAVALEHAQAHERSFPDEGFLPMRKHLGWYIKDFPYASDYRSALVLANSSEEVAQILDSIPKTN